MSSELKEFSPYVSADIPNCPGFIIERAVLSAIIEFCSKSWRLNEEAEDIDADEGEAIISFPASGSNVAVGVFDVRYDGETLDRRTIKEMNNLYAAGWKKRTGPPECYINEDNGRIRLYPIPDKDYRGSISARVAVAPKMSAVRVDDLFKDYYFEPIISGAISRLLLQEGKTWYNPGLAPAFSKTFYDAIYSARNIVMRDVYQTSPLPKML